MEDHTPAPANPPHQHPVRHHRMGARLISGLVFIAALGLAAYLSGSGIVEKLHDLNAKDYATDYTQQTYTTADGKDCTIAVIPVVGELFVTAQDADQNGGTAANTVAAQIQQAVGDHRIKGIMLQVNSPGGSPVGGEIIANALKASTKPSVALIQDLGDSAAYLASTGAGRIFASAMSDVGDIGVTGSYLDYSGEEAKNGEQFVQISAGKYKDAGNPDRALSSDEKALLQKSVDEEYATLVSEVAVNRHVATSTIENLANGASEPGSVAINDKLIDEIGDGVSVATWFGKKIGTTAVLCK